MTTETKVGYEVQSLDSEDNTWTLDETFQESEFGKATHLLRKLREAFKHPARLVKITTTTEVLDL